MENNPTTFGDPDGHVPVGCSNADVRQCQNRSKKDNEEATRQRQWQEALLEAQAKAKAKRAQNTSGKTIAKGAGEVGLGGAAIGLAIVLAPETGGGSLAALGVAAGVLGGTAEVGNGIVDIAHGAGQVDAQTAEEAKQGINIANNPVAANALIVTNANNAEKIGNVANGIMAAHDLATRPEGVADAFNKLLGARDVKEGYQSGKELMHQVGSYVQEHAQSLYQYF